MHLAEWLPCGRSGSHTIASDADYYAYSWGLGTSGQLGRVSTSYIVPGFVRAGQQNPVNPEDKMKNIISVSGGEFHSVFLERYEYGSDVLKGRVLSCGNNYLGVSGTNQSLPVLAVAPDLGEEPDGSSDTSEYGSDYLYGIKAISAGWHHTVAAEAIDPEHGLYGQVYTWGRGPLGNPGLSLSNPTWIVPVQVFRFDESTQDYVLLGNIIDVSAGEAHSMALEKIHDVSGHPVANIWIWGGNINNYYHMDNSAVLGNPAYTSTNYAVKVIAPDRNNDGQPDDLDSNPATVDYLGDDIPIVAISAGYWHCLALDADGNLYSWGYNALGHLGIGNNENKNVPQLLPPLGARVKNLDAESRQEDPWSFTIQEAIDDAQDGDELVAYPGVYQEKVTLNKAVYIRSLEPDDPAIVAQTVIQMENSDVVEIASNCSLKGFTITGGCNGIAYSGSGVSPVICNNIIHGNSNDGIKCNGDSSFIHNNIIYGNGTTSGYGVHIVSGSANICNNTIVANLDGGIKYDAGTPVVRNCILYGNYEGEPATPEPDNNVIGAIGNLDYCALETGEMYSGGSYNVSINADAFESLNPEDFYSLKTMVDDGGNPVVNPCINGGVSVSYDDGQKDIAGKPRILGGALDIGANEFSPYLVEAGEAKTAIFDVPLLLDDAQVEYKLPTSLDDVDVWVEWSVLSQPGTSTPSFDDPCFLNTTVTFSGTQADMGEYALLLEVFEDSNLVGYDIVVVDVRYDVAITVLTEPEPQGSVINPALITLPDNKVYLDADILPIGGSFVCRWYGPQEVQVDFNDPDQEDTYVTFYKPGIYTLALRIFDEESHKLLGEGKVVVTVGHQQVSVDAGDYDHLSWPQNRIDLEGIIISGQIASTQWQVSEEAQEYVTFGDAADLQTWVEFSSPGEYGIGLLAYDAEQNIIGADVVTIYVDAPDIMVNAGADQVITLPKNFVYLSGSVDAGGGITHVWDFDGPDDYLTIENASGLNTKVVFQDVDGDDWPEAGKYEFALLAKDSTTGEVYAYDTVIITVIHDNVTVDAGADQNVLMASGGKIVQFDGKVTGTSYDTLEWLPSCQNTSYVEMTGASEATIYEAGEYQFWLLAKIGDNIVASDDVIITVDYQEAKVDAGQDRVIENFPLTKEASLHGRVLEGAYDSILWVFPDEVVVHGPDDKFDTWVEFPGPGIYTFGFSALMNDYTMGWDSMTVFVYPQGYATTVEISVQDSNPNCSMLVASVNGEYSEIRWKYCDPGDLNLYTVFPNPEYPDHLYVSFYEAGEYSFGVEVLNTAGEVIAVDEVTITITPANRQDVAVNAYVVDSSSNHYAYYETRIGDDPLNLEGVITGTYDQWVWADPSAGSGTGTIVFSNADGDVNEDIETTATFSKIGEFHIDLLAKNATGSILNTGKVVVVVYPAGYNLVPVKVNAGPDQEIELPIPMSAGKTITLQGSFELGTSDVKWFDPSEGLIEFIGSETSLNPEVRFTVPGVYHLALAALDTNDNIIDSDECIIDVSGPDSDEVYIHLSMSPEEGITYSLENYVTLIADVRGCGDDISTEWSAPDGVSLSSPFDRNTKVSFAGPGNYPITFKVKDAGNATIGWSKIHVFVGQPEALVEALAQQTSGGWADSYEGTFSGSPMNIAMKADVNGLPEDDQRLTYQWSLVDAPDSVTSVNWNPSDASETPTVTFSAAGYYILGLSLKFDGVETSYDEIGVLLQSGDPIVEAGSNYPLVEVNTSLTLDKARVWDDQPISNLTFEWSQDDPEDPAISFSPSENVLNPTISASVAGAYELKLTVVDGNNNEAWDTTTIFVRAPYDIRAGGPYVTTPNTNIRLDDASVNPQPAGMVFEWSVSPTNAAVTFKPDRHQLQPEVNFSEPGDYLLTLHVSDETGPLGSSSCNVTVLPSGDSDTDDPILTDFVAKFNNGATNVEDATSPDYVSGPIDITVIAEDENLDHIALRLLSGSINQSIDGGDCTILAGTANHPTKMKLEHTLYAYPSGEVTLRVDVYDRSGNCATEVKSFTSTQSIQSFTVEPSEITSSSQMVTFTGDLATSGNWTFQIFNEQWESVSGSNRSGSNNPALVTDSAANLGLTTAGNYHAALMTTTEGDTAYVPFVVTYGLSYNNLTAKLDDDLKQHNYTEKDNGEEYDTGMPEEGKYVINQGFIDIKGIAYYSGFDEEVRWQLSLIPEGGSSINVTPGVLDDDGYCHGAVGQTPSTLGSFGTVDVSNIADGICTLRLKVECCGLIKSDQARVIISNPVKIGHVKFSQEDLSITVGGYPIRIIRTYDGLRRHEKGDFGCGWTYSLANMDIEISESGNPFDRDVTLTLPDGQRTTFSSYLYLEGTDYDELNIESLWSLQYKTPEGINATFTTSELNELQLIPLSAGDGEPTYGAFFGYQWKEGSTTYDTEYADKYSSNIGLFDSSGYTLTMLDNSAIFHIKRVLGDIKNLTYQYGRYQNKYRLCGAPYLDSIEFANKDALVFEMNLSDAEKPITEGVKYRRGEYGTPTMALYLERDSANRITEIYPPSELDANGVPLEPDGIPYVKYEYDNYGNLTKVSRLVDRDTEDYECTYYVYNDGVYLPDDHYVTDIKDDRGITAIRYEYDGEGWLIATIDGNGNRIELSHNNFDGTDAETGTDYSDAETVTDRSGNTTSYYYDSHGEVVLVIREVGGSTEITKYVHTRNYQDKIVKTVTTQYYTDFDNNACTSVSETRFDGVGRPVLNIDPVKNATETHYDASGNVDYMIQWKPLNNETASFPEDYPYNDLVTPIDYEKVTTTCSYYNDRQQVIVSGMKSNTNNWLQLSLNYYDTASLLLHSVQVGIKPNTNLSDFYTDYD